MSSRELYAPSRRKAQGGFELRTVFAQVLDKHRSIPGTNNASDGGKLARLAGLEPTTPGFGGQYSIH